MRWRRSLALLLVGALGLGACGGDDGGDGDGGIEGVASIRVTDSSHTLGSVDYDLRPPAGGPHHPVWWSCGFYTEPVIDEHAVHDLEHGVVWLAYSPDLPAADVDVLRELTNANAKVLAAPYEGLPEDDAVVATAWARQLHLPSVDDPRLEEFVARYQDGSQAPEAGASCSDGLG